MRKDLKPKFISYVIIWKLDKEFKATQKVKLTLQRSQTPHLEYTCIS